MVKAENPPVVATPPFGSQQPTILSMFASNGTEKTMKVHKKKERKLMKEKSNREKFVTLAGMSLGTMFLLPLFFMWGWRYGLSELWTEAPDVSYWVCFWLLLMIRCTKLGITGQILRYTPEDLEFK